MTQPITGARIGCRTMTSGGSLIARRTVHERKAGDATPIPCKVGDHVVIELTLDEIGHAPLDNQLGAGQPFTQELESWPNRPGLPRRVSERPHFRSMGTSSVGLLQPSMLGRHVVRFAHPMHGEIELTIEAAAQ
jgi:hypothetical protein